MSSAKTVETRDCERAQAEGEAGDGDPEALLELVVNVRQACARSASVLLVVLEQAPKILIRKRDDIAEGTRRFGGR